MKIWQKIGIGVIVTLLLLFGFLSWYRYTYSMDYVPEYEINALTAVKKVLIATQGSLYKNEVVEAITSEFPEDDVYFKIMDVSHLGEIKTEDWDAIVIIHTWENWEAPLNVRTFLENQYDQNKMIVHTTSGDGNYKMEGIDAISGESDLNEVDAKAWYIKERLNSVLGIK